MSNEQINVLSAGETRWNVGNGNSMPGVRIYPGWQGAYDGKRIVCKDWNVLPDGTITLVDAFRGVEIARFENIGEVDAYIRQNGKVVEPGENVWD